MYTSFDGYFWICKTRDGTLFPIIMPIQVKADGLNLSEIPPELSCLSPLENEIDILACPIYENGGTSFRQAALYT